MKLYYSPGACSLAPHIILRELDIEFDLVQVDLFSKKTEFGDDFFAISTHGRVPALQLSNEEILTESVAVLQYLADQHLDAGLAPKNSTFARARLQEVFNFLTSDLHKAFGPMFAGGTEENKQQAMQTIESKFDYLNTLLTGKEYLIDNKYSVADAYLFVLTSWTFPTGMDLNKWPNLAEYFGRIAARPAVIEAMQAEGLNG